MVTRERSKLTFLETVYCFVELLPDQLESIDNF